MNIKRSTKTIILIMALFVVSGALSGCDGTDSQPLFQRFGNGIDVVSEEGLTDLWNVTKTLSSSNVTIVESFYNNDSIWIGFRMEGNELISHGFWTSFMYNGERISNGGHGGVLRADIVNWIQETVQQPGYDARISELPDEFLLEFIVGDLKYQDRTVSFNISLERSDREVVWP